MKGCSARDDGAGTPSASAVSSGGGISQSQTQSQSPSIAMSPLTARATLASFTLKENDVLRTSLRACEAVDAQHPLRTRLQYYAELSAVVVVAGAGGGGGAMPSTAAMLAVELTYVHLQSKCEVTHLVRT